jgi:hypothetical protein
MLEADSRTGLQLQSALRYVARFSPGSEGPHVADLENFPVSYRQRHAVAPEPLGDSLASACTRSHHVPPVSGRQVCQPMPPARY